MGVCVIGTGYVGLVTGACFAEMGNMVVCVDKEPARIEGLQRGEIPIHEAGLDAMVSRNCREGRLVFTTSLAAATETCDVFFISVGTPPMGDGSADLQGVLEVARALGETVKRYSLVVTKSTVPVGTADQVRGTIGRALDARGVGIEVDVASNPEFLKEGSAVEDFMRPDRIIIGCDQPRAVAKLQGLYAAFTRSHERILVMSPRDAEMTKYVANGMLATKISFMNEIAGLCEVLGADVENVRRGIGADARIGFSFIYAGCGYGGSCFPKDVKALIHTARLAGFEPLVLRAVEARNDAQKRRLFEKVVARFGADLSARTFGVWGLAFKPGTDDVREAPAVELLRELIGAGARVKAHDPAAMGTARRVLPREWFDSRRLELYDHQYDAVAGADALILVTEWKPFRQPDLGVMRGLMKQLVVFDGRNQYNPTQMRAEGFEYFGIGRGGGAGTERSVVERGHR